MNKVIIVAVLIAATPALAQSSPDETYRQQMQAYVQVSQQQIGEAAIREVQYLAQIQYLQAQIAKLTAKKQDGKAPAVQP